jgi:hypothetical protein
MEFKFKFKCDIYTISVLVRVNLQDEYFKVTPALTFN